MPLSADQLKQFAKAYKTAFTNAGGDQAKVANEQEIVKKLEARGVQSDQQAQQAGQEDAQSGQSGSSGSSQGQGKQPQGQPKA